MNEKASGEDRRGIDDLTLNRLREKARKLKRERGISHGKALEEVAREAGFQSWHKATLSLPEGGHRTEPDGDEAGKTAAEAVPGAGREAKARRSEAHSDCPWEREKAEATRVLVACGNGFDHMSEAFQLLMARFLERWDNGVPISMMPGATGAIPYLVAECLGDLAARGVTTPASQVTLGIILERGATVRQGEKPMDAAEFIRLVIVHNGFQELAMTAGSGWRRDGSACPERRFRLVYDAWMKSEAVEQEVVYEMMRGLVSHASGMSVTGMIMLKRQASGFYGNADFPVTPPMNYDAKDIQTVAVKVGRNETLTFLWAENNSSDHYRVAVCDWNAKLTDTQTGRLKAYCGGTAYFPKDREGAVTPFSMGEAADVFTGTYEETIGAYAAYVARAGSIDGPVVLVHYVERHPDAVTGAGVRCLEEALALCDEKMVDSPWTCFVHVLPSQWTTARRSVGASKALIAELQAAELSLSEMLHRMVDASDRLPANMEIVWDEKRSYTMERDSDE